MAEARYNKADDTASVKHEGIQEPTTAAVHGLNVPKTCTFIVGVIAGAGFLSLPKAVDDTGWVGFILVITCCSVSAYTGILLGKCWMIVREERPELKEKNIGDPYPTIAEVTYGKPARYLVSFSMSVTLFGGAVVYILLAAQNIQELLPADSGMNICYLSLIIGGVMTPFTWFGTPKEFWGIAALAAAVTGTASVILFVDVIATTKAVDVIHTDVGVISFFTGYGTICFAFNGHAAFPTFQADMKEPFKFGRAIMYGYIVVLLMYVPCSALGFVVFGKNIDANIIVNMSSGPAKTIVSILITSHLLFGLIILINPISQALEDSLNIPKNFTWKRIISRTCMMAAAMFVAESVPHFSSILALTGGSTISILAIICPNVFYMKLARSPSIPEEKRNLPLHQKVLHIEIMLIGIVAGVAATYSAISDLATNKFTVPCYVDPVRATQ